MSDLTIETRARVTPNGAPYVSKRYARPGFSASVIVGDIESFDIQVDWAMTFYPDDVREMAKAFNVLADEMERNR